MPGPSLVLSNLLCLTFDPVISLLKIYTFQEQHVKICREVFISAMYDAENWKPLKGQRRYGKVKYGTPRMEY